MSESAEGRQSRSVARATDGGDDPLGHTGAWFIAGAVLFILYVVFFASLRHEPYSDLRNHVVRAELMREALFHGGAPNYEITLHFVPYILGDLVLAGVLEILPISVAPELWVCFILLSLPFALVYYYVSRGEQLSTMLPVLLTTPYVATSYFFLSGFTNFCLGMSLCFVTLGFWERAVRARAVVPLYWLGVVACYLMHLSAFFFCGVAVAVTGCTRYLFGDLRLRDLVLSAVPLAALLLWHTGEGAASMRFRGLTEKLFALGGMSIRYTPAADGALLGIFFVAALILAFSARRARDHESYRRRIEFVALFAASLLTFFLLPEAFGSGLGVDVRALPFAFLFLFSALSAFAGKQTVATVVIVLGGMANLAVIAPVLLGQERFLALYDEGVRSVPSGLHLLPIDTREPVGRISTTVTAALPYALRGTVPNLFSRNLHPEQFPYFAYRDQFWMPDTFWYLRGVPLDWGVIRKTYQAVIVTKPFEPARIEIEGLQEIFSNPAVAVFRLPEAVDVIASEAK